jgi:hypothetical protein
MKAAATTLIPKVTASATQIFLAQVLGYRLEQRIRYGGNQVQAEDAEGQKALKVDAPLGVEETKKERRGRDKCPVLNIEQGSYRRPARFAGLLLFCVWRGERNSAPVCAVLR